MDVNHINPILNAFTNVLPQLGFCNINKKGITIKDKIIESLGVLIIINITGDLEGKIVYCMNEDDAKAIASSMMMGMQLENFDDMAKSAVSELVNMLTANAATNLSNENVKVDISTPLLIYGTHTEESTVDKTLCVSMNVNNTVVDVNISLQSNIA